MSDIFKIIKLHGNPYFTLAEELACYKDNFSKKLLKAFNAIFKNEDSEKIVIELNKMDIFTSPSSEITFFYYLFKGALEIKCYLPSLAKKSILNAKEYLSKEAPEHIKDLYVFHLNKVEPPYKRNQKYLEIFNKLNIKNDLNFWIWKNIANHLAAVGLLPIKMKDRDVVNRYRQYPDTFNIFMFAQHVSKVDLLEAKKYLALIPKDKYDISVFCNIRLMNLLEGDFEATNWDNYQIGDVIIDRFYDFLKALRTNQPKLALRIAKEIATRADPLIHWTKSSLIDAELCNFNVAAASYLLDQQESELSSSDYLRLARIAYQKEELKKCAEYFIIAQDGYRKIDQYKRFLFDLNCAIDLSSADILVIMNEVNRINNSSSKSLKFTPKLLNKSNQIKSGTDRYVGISKNSVKVRDDIAQYSKLNAYILITGETGSGKEVVAQAIHEESSQRKEPFLPINCGAIVGSLLQSELFGHKAGSFTSAQKDHVGIFEAAGKGTVFLDEFGEMSQQTQIALLRVLESNQIRPIGSSRAKNIQCRIIAATNANIQELIKKGTFRSDLYYRLKSFEIKLSPLRKRKKDVLVLVNHFLNEGLDEKCQIDKEAKELLVNYSWPGNTRELKNEMQKLRMLSSNKRNFSMEDFSFIERTLNTYNRTDLKDMNEGELSTVEPEVELAVNYNATHKRILTIKTLFEKHKILKRIQLIKTLNIAQTTATKDLKQLIEEGFIVKVMPGKSSRTHYFELV